MIHTSKIYYVKKQQTAFLGSTPTSQETFKIKTGNIIEYVGLASETFVDCVGTASYSYIKVKVLSGAKIGKYVYIPANEFAGSTVQVVLGTPMKALEVASYYAEGENSGYQFVDKLERLKLVAVSEIYYDRIVMFKITDKEPLTVRTFRFADKDSLPILIHTSHA